MFSFLSGALEHGKEIQIFSSGPVLESAPRCHGLCRLPRADAEPRSVVKEIGKWTFSFYDNFRVNTP